MYNKNGSKNRNGGINQRCVENKVIPIFPCPESGVRCHFTILQKYISNLTPIAMQKDWFYLKALGDSAIDPSKPWYAAQPCSENKLGGMVKSMFAEIGVSGRTNQSTSNRSFRYVTGGRTRKDHSRKNRAPFYRSSSYV